MNDAPAATWGGPTRTVGRMVVYRVVDAHLNYVTVYVPFAASSAEDVAATIAHAIATQPKPVPREDFSNG